MGVFNQSVFTRRLVACDVTATKQDLGWCWKTHQQVTYLTLGIYVVCYSYSSSCTTHSMADKMAGTGRGSLRPYQPSKGHNFLVVGLLFVVLVLSYNYWMVSVTKNQQTNEIFVLQTSLQKQRQIDSLLKVWVRRNTAPPALERFAREEPK